MEEAYQNRLFIRGVKAAAKHCDVSPATIRRWMRGGALNHSVVSRQMILFRPEDLDEAVDRLARNYRRSRLGTAMTRGKSSMSD